MGEFDTDNDMMNEQQARDTHGTSRQPQGPGHDIDARSEADRKAAHNATIKSGRADDAVLADNRAGLKPGGEDAVRKSGIRPPLALRGRSLLGN